jgi:hypothetical protein
MHAIAVELTGDDARHAARKVIARVRHHRHTLLAACEIEETQLDALCHARAHRESRVVLSEMRA